MMNTNGINNLIIIISILSILRFLIEDYREFGWIMSIPLSEIDIQDIQYFISSILIIFMRSCFSYFITSRSLNSCMCLFNIFLSEYYIIYLNIYKINHIYLSGWSLILNLIFLAKIVSFHISCKNLTILSLNDFLYFLIIPTLCYQDKFIKKETRNFKKIFYKLILLVLGLFLFVFVTDQYSIPSIYRIKNTKDIYILFENAINLALSTAFLFIIFFNLVFVCCLDILAELTFFTDNEFYQAWWNSTTLGEFWTLWNIPVHKWLKIYVYLPCKNKLGRRISQGICFIISAFFHEYVLSISTKKFNGLVFLAMIGQIPYIYISELFKRYLPDLSNYFFWCSFLIIGQPAMVFLYYRSEEIL